MTSVQEPNYFGGRIKILLTNMANVSGYQKYIAMLKRKNDFHNIIDCIIIDGYHPTYCDLHIVIGDQVPQKTYRHLIYIEGVFDVVETNESQSEGKYFIIVDKNIQQQAKQTINVILEAIINRFNDIADNKVNMLYKTFPSL